MPFGAFGFYIVIMNNGNKTDMIKETILFRRFVEGWTDFQD